MRLIHTAKLELDEFFDADVPKHAILSHCLGKNEVTHQDFLNGTNRDGAGFSKITECCKLAAENEIDAELSEAINSIFDWYKSAVVCYTFLSDVVRKVEESEQDERDYDLSGSRWFTRGWTLQQPLAPQVMTFYDGDLREIGSTDSLADTISGITGIDCDYLRKPETLHGACVAQEMCWAASRQTSRVEDRAYSLLGLFDVVMLLLYGEGRKAFRRLQEHIIAQTNDETGFPWTSEASITQSGMLAPWPDRLAKSDNMNVLASQSEN